MARMSTALGLVLFELVTGKRAFEGKTYDEIMRVRRESTPHQLSTPLRGLDPTVELVISRCLESTGCLGIIAFQWIPLRARIWFGTTRSGLRREQNPRVQSVLSGGVDVKPWVPEAFGVPQPIVS